MDRCELYLQNRTSFEWFIIDYFGQSVPNRCKELAEAGEELELLNILNEIWFKLPDEEFNIKVAPKGWFEFLQVIEE